MKVIKKKELSLFPRPMFLQGRQHLALGVLLYFDLTAPDALLDEQDLWKTIPKELGDTPILDQGVPKMNAEYLVVGDCCAPRNETRQSSEIFVRVGDLRKRLYIYGDRHWQDSGAISDPEAFTRMPVTWENAFGGMDWERNPLGKGIEQGMVGEKVRVPLPNVEDPEHLVGLVEDRPEPASLGPMDVTWPQRNMKSGTYDDRWKAERWPGLPDDFDFNFFNAAPTNQRKNGFFNGDESIEIRNMHPDYQFLKSSLPGLRVRCFTTQLENFKRFEDRTSFTEVFQEVRLHPETIWLFPNILRGVLIYRGAIPIADEDMADVVRVYLATESMAEAPLDKEHYFEEQKKALDRGVPVDLAPFEAAKGKLSKLALTMKNVPKEAAHIRKRANGQLPTMPRTAGEIASKGKGVLAARMKTLDKLEALATRMNGKWGHVVRVDTATIGKMRQKIAKVEGDIDKAVGKLDAASKKAAAKKASIITKNKKFLEDNLTPEQIKQAGVDPNQLFPDKKVNPWHDRGFPFVVQCRRNLEQDQEMQGKLARMGLSPKTIRRSWLGVNTAVSNETGELWGLKSPQQFKVPEGIVVPRFDGKVLNRIVLRLADAPEDTYLLGQNEQLVPGSDKTPLFLEAAQPQGIGGAPEDAAEKDEKTWAPVVVAGDDLQALFVEQEAGDACGVLAMKTPAEKPGPDAAQALEKAMAVLVIMPEGHNASRAAWEPWGKAMKGALPLPLPKGRTVFEAKAANVDVRALIMDALPPQFAKHHELFPDLSPEKGEMAKVKVPGLGLDIGAFVASLMQDVKGAHQPKIDKVKANRGKMIESLKQQFGSKGLDPEHSLAEAAKQPRKSYAEMGDEMSQQMLAQGRKVEATGNLSAEAKAKLESQAAKVREISQKSQARYERHTARLKEMNQKAEKMAAQARSKKLPGLAGERMAASGLDPDALNPLTREQVIERYKAGQSFEKRNLTGVDLSGLELPGIDLRKAILDKTLFKESNLSGARFEGSVVKEVDFSKADLTGANMKGALFPKSKFVEASLREANLERVMLRGVDMTKADCSGARLYLIHAEKGKFDEANFADTDCRLGMLASCSMNKVFFRGAKLNKFVFRECAIDQGDFGGATLARAVFQGSHGENVRFVGANMDNARIISKSNFPRADLRRTTLHGACFRESFLQEAEFDGAVLDTALIEGCSLVKAKMERISAKNARITKCDLEAAKLAGVNLAMGSLRMTRLVQTDFTGANLFAVDFYKATVGKTRFRLANLKRTLLFENTDLFK